MSQADKKICLFVPLHITAPEDIYMANMQARFFSFCKTKLHLVSVMTIDYDATTLFDRMFVKSGTDFLIDLRDKPAAGIVFPTFCAIDKAVEHQCEIMVRITQDTSVIDFDRFIALVRKLSAQQTDFICGRKDVCQNIKEHVESLGLKWNMDSYNYVQGNIIIAGTNLWQKRYKQLPPSVRHYCDDSVFSYLLEMLDGVKPIFIERDFWYEFRTKDVYLLESFYNNRKDFAQRG
jgi:hypothetical protein